MFGDGKFIRIDPKLDTPIHLDDARPATLKKMEKIAREAIETHENGRAVNDFDALVKLLKL